MLLRPRSALGCLGFLLGYDEEMVRAEIVRRVGFIEVGGLGIGPTADGVADPTVSIRIWISVSLPSCSPTAATASSIFVGDGKPRSAS